jgi:hypothetical protein
VGKVGPLAAQGMRWDAYAQEWFVDFAEKNLARKTGIDYAELWDRHLLDRIGRLTSPRRGGPHTGTGSSRTWRRRAWELPRSGS